MATASLYEVDFYGWTQEQVELLRSGRLDEIDLYNVIEEIDDMGKRQKQELRSRLTVLFMHLLKWQYQPNLQGKSWISTIKIQRFEIKNHLIENPSLKSSLDETIKKAWQSALLKAEHETGLDSATFPQECPWTFEQAINDDFWPET